MPIAGITEVVRLPRLGKIRLGIKREGAKGTYPSATEYFVCPPEVQEVYGERPKRLDIMFPLDEEALVAPQWLRCYSQSRGCVCWGDGRTANRLVDKATGGLVHGDSGEVAMAPISCDPDSCPEYQTRRCRRLMNLQFFLPRVGGIGVWQLNTGSRNSIHNINGMLRTIRAACGRVAMIPLTLSLEPYEAAPLGIPLKEVYVLQLRSSLTLAAVQKLGTVEPTRILLPAPDLAAADEDFYPSEVLEGGAAGAPEPGADGDFPPALTEEEEREECWKEILAARETTAVSVAQMVKWFRQRQAFVSAHDLRGAMPPESIALGLLKQLRDNLRSYQAKVSQVKAAGA